MINSCTNWSNIICSSHILRNNDSTHSRYRSKILSFILTMMTVTLMGMQVYHVFPHICQYFYKVLISVFTFTSLSTYFLASRTRPSYLINYSRNPNNLLSLLKKCNPDKICPSCELVQQVGTKHCTACNVCIIDYDQHSSLVDNCITRKNRIFYLVYLTSMVCFLITMIIVSLAHFDSPSLEDVK